jgi:hypothetical protein
MAWAPDYAQVSDLATYVRIGDDDDDAQLGLAVTTSSRAIDRHCRRQFGLVAAPEVRYYQPRWDRRSCRWVADIDDLMTTTGLLVDGDAVVGPVLLPRNAAVRGEPWTVLAVDASDEVAVTARWGWTAIPNPIKQACLLQASRLFARRGSPFGVAGSPEMGNELRLLAKVDPDVAVALAPYRKVAQPR